MIKLPKISQYFKNNNFIDQESNVQSDDRAENDVHKSGGIAEPDNSEYLNLDQQQPSTSTTQSDSFLDIEKLKSSPYVTDKGNFKELNHQVKRFVIENGHCKPKGPFLRDSNNRSFLDKYYYTVSKSGVKLERTHGCIFLCCFKRRTVNHVGCSQIEHLKLKMRKMFGLKAIAIGNILLKL